MKKKSNHKNFVHLVGLYTYCKMMHGAYNIKLPAVVFCKLLSEDTSFKILWEIPVVFPDRGFPPSLLVSVAIIP